MPSDKEELLDETDGGFDHLNDPTIPDKDTRHTYSYVRHATNGKVRRYSELVCDYEGALKYLPTDKAEIAVGSKCLCLENGKTYVLSNHREWALPSDYTPSSGGISVDDSGSVGPVGPVDEEPNDPLGGLGNR